MHRTERYIEEERVVLVLLDEVDGLLGEGIGQVVRLILDDDTIPVKGIFVPLIGKVASRSGPELC